ATGHGVVEAFDYEGRCAFREDEAVASGVERFAGLLRVACGAGEATHRGERCNHQRHDRRLAATSDDHLGVAAAHRLERFADVVTARRAGGGHGHVRAFGAELDGDVPAGRVGDHVGDQGGGHASVAPFEVGIVVIEDQIEAACA